MTGEGLKTFLEREPKVGAPRQSGADRQPWAAAFNSNGVVAFSPALERSDYAG